MLKKGGIINPELLSELQALRHTEKVVIADPGLPRVEGAKEINLALTSGIPSFADVFNSIFNELAVERGIIASEMQSAGDQAARAKNLVTEAFQKHQYVLTSESHEEFKNLTKGAKLVVVHGEGTRYSNVILVAGVHFPKLTD
jgi:D-ribose pyranase